MYCGDDSRSKRIAGELICDVGFDPVDAGPLRIARYTEPFALLVAQLAEPRTGVPVRAVWTSGRVTRSRSIGTGRRRRPDESSVKEKTMTQGIKDKVVVITGASSGLPRWMRARSLLLRLCLRATCSISASMARFALVQEFQRIISGTRAGLQ